MDLVTIWFGLLGVLLAGYAVLDGFDLGVGILHPLAKTDHERRLFVNAIGPLWDGNEVWLVTFGGALFAMFPEAYASIFSGFYIALMLLLFGLVLRAVSLEMRSKRESMRWRRFWDGGFFVSSLVSTLLFGVAVGNAVKGIPLDQRGNYAGSFFDLLHPIPSSWACSRSRCSRCTVPCTSSSRPRARSSSGSARGSGTRGACS